MSHSQLPVLFLLIAELLYLWLQRASSIWFLCRHSGDARVESVRGPQSPIHMCTLLWGPLPRPLEAHVTRFQPTAYDGVMDVTATTGTQRIVALAVKESLSCWLW